MDGDSGYALQKLELAIDDLAIGSGDVRSRLNLVYRDHLHVLREADFPDNLRPDWSWIMRKMTRLPARRDEHGNIMIGSVERTLRRMRNSTGTQIAKRIVTLSAMLRGHLKDLAKRH